MSTAMNEILKRIRDEEMRKFISFKGANGVLIISVCYICNVSGHLSLRLLRSPPEPSGSRQFLHRPLRDGTTCSLALSSDLAQ